MNNPFNKNKNKEKSLQDQVRIKNKKNKFDYKNIVQYLPMSILVLTHIAIIIAIILSFRYYAIYPSLFGSVVGIVVCILIISDIIYFVGFNHEDKILKIITIILSIFLLLGGTVGSYLLGNVNTAVDSIFGSNNDSYETVNGVFSCYTDKHSYESIEAVNGKKIGFISETSEGISTIAKKILNSNNIDFVECYYSSITDMLFALVDDDINAAVFPDGYKSLLLKDENNDYSTYLEKMDDFYEFTQDVKIVNKNSSKNISKEPFNVLLIGWSRVELGSSVGLADAIIVVTVNPQTYTASMMSIARDSYVDIPCYGNTKDKINSGRSTSRACFIETVEQLVGEEMDFYIEADYEAIVYLVNALGGIEINNPVDFTLDGVYVPAGTYVAEGWQALEFCRERHHMPNGDFDRQQHQKEVILACMRKFIEAGDIQLALDVMKITSNFMSTDLTLNQLTTMFNMILNTKNYTGLDTFDLLDFQTMRMAGYASWHYSYDYYLPLWIYKLYDSSVAECIEHMNNIKQYQTTSDQKYSFTFSSSEPYIREPFYSLSFDEKEEHETMPAFYPYLTNMSYQEALEWSKNNNVELKPTFIMPSDENYVSSLDGMVVSQDVRYGRLVSENPICEITVMGTGDLSGLVKDFVGKPLYKVIEWADEMDYDVIIDEWEFTDNFNKYGLVYEQDIEPYSSVDEYDEIHVKVYDYLIPESSLSELKLKTSTEHGTTYKDTIAWINKNLYYRVDTNFEKGELLSYSCDDEKIKYSTRGCKFNFSDGKTTKNKDYSELTEAEREIAEIEWTDIDGEGSIGACSLLYINDELDSVTCSGTRQRCGEHEERDSNGACQFKPYDEVSVSCPFGEPSETLIDEGTSSPYYVVSYTSADKTSGSCKLYNPPAEEESGGTE